MKMKKLMPLLLLITILSPAFGQSGEVFTTEEGAIHGYDPVAYFNQGKAVKGKKEFSYLWNGAQWFFSSKQNMETFKSKPEKYAPQYGGYCAYGTSEGHKAPTEADAFTVVGDKLYFNYNKEVRTDWAKNQKDLIKKADKNWPSVKKQ
jgi:YHS domain-containing protein